MTTKELNLELLLGKCVIDANGDRVGRIEEIRAEQQDNEWIVTEYLVGINAVVERLSAWNLGTSFLRMFGARKLNHSYRIPWDKLNLSDPHHPRLLCTTEELKQITQDERSKNER